MTTVLLLWLISSIGAGFNRRSSNHGCLVYSRSFEMKKADIYLHRRVLVLIHARDKASITYEKNRYRTLAAYESDLMVNKIATACNL